MRSPRCINCMYDTQEQAKKERVKKFVYTAKETDESRCCDEEKIKAEKVHTRWTRR